MPTYEILLNVQQSIRIRVAADDQETANAIAQFHYTAGEAYDGDSVVVSTTEVDGQPDIDQQEIDLSELGLDQ